jgi:hypothetical protein
MAALVPLLLSPAVAEVQFQVVIFFRGIYSKDLYHSPIEPFVVVYSGGGATPGAALVSVYTVRWACLNQAGRQISPRECASPLL